MELTAPFAFHLPPQFFDYENTHIFHMLNLNCFSWSSCIPWEKWWSSTLRVQGRPWKLIGAVSCMNWFLDALLRSEVHCQLIQAVVPLQSGSSLIPTVFKAYWETCTLFILHLSFLFFFFNYIIFLSYLETGRKCLCLCQKFLHFEDEIKYLSVPCLLGCTPASFHILRLQIASCFSCIMASVGQVWGCPPTFQWPVRKAF